MNPTRVAFRYLLGGLITPPPAMFKAIRDWVLAIRAAQEQQDLLEQRKRAVAWDQERKGRLQELKNAALALQASPTSWKAYKALYDLAGFFGNPGPRWKVRDFQKMTPEKAEALTRRVQALTDQYLKWIRREERRPPRTESIDEKLKTIKPFLRAGVQADETKRKFPVDLSGWKYDRKDIEDRIKAQVQQSAARLLERVKGVGTSGSHALDDIISHLTKQVMTGDPGWRSIWVVLEDGNWQGHWNAMSHTLTVSTPRTLSFATNSDAKHVADIVRHELIHFAQSYLSEMVDGVDMVRAGLPSRKIRTPEYKQEYWQGHPRFNKDSPEVQRVWRRLQQEGVDPREIDFHSLDDVEFYTKLADAIALFRDREQRINEGLRNGPMTRKEKQLAIRAFVHARTNPKTEREKSIQAAFVGPQFFHTLKRRAPEKWRKATADLVKAVL